MVLSVRRLDTSVVRTYVLGSCLSKVRTGPQRGQRDSAARNVSIPALKTGQPRTFADSADYTQQLHRCLHDEDLPTDTRTAGALILLYGFRTTDVLALRSDQVIERDHDHYLRFAGNLLLLPPPLAALLKQLPLPRNNNRSVLLPPDNSAPLLFPGFSDTRPLHSGTFGTRLLRYGLTPRAGRNTAMLTLAADLPASVLADLLGIHEVTATRWATRTKRDWHTYLAQRRIDSNDPIPGNCSERVFE